MASPATDRELVRRGGFAKFVQLAWHVIDTSTLVWEPHMQLLADHYDAVSRGEITRLVVNVPPGTGKTLITCVLWPAWDWITNPRRKWMFIGYSDDKVRESADLHIRLVRSEWFQERWGDVVGNIEGGERAASGRFYNTHGGMRMSTTMNSSATGFHVDIQVCDDPNKAQDLDLGGDSAREKMSQSVARWRGAFATRTGNRLEFRRVVIMQRLHEADLAGDCIAAGYQALILPMEFEPERAYRSKWGSDWRTEEGELLAPKRFPREVIDMLKTGADAMTALDWAAQMQQRPSPAAGVVFSTQHFQRRWDARPSNLGRIILSVDATFKETKNSDFCVIQVWGQRTSTEFYLLDQWRKRTGLHGAIEATLALRAQWGATTVIVEDRANGSAVIETLRGQIPGVVPVQPEGGKEARAWSIQPMLEHGSVVFPSDRVAPWMEGFVANAVGFPTARYDDEVDAMSQALRYLAGRGRRAKWRDAIGGMSKLAGALGPGRF